MKFTYLALAAGLVCMTAPVLATDAYDACARAAASQYEPGYASVGRNSTDIDVSAATAACQAALEESPDSLQLKAWLGRVYKTAEDYTNALPLLEEAANGGVPLAQAIYGDLLIVGENVSSDWTRGNELLDQAAALGFAPAMNSLALSYDYGEGVAQDYATALAYYRRAALLGLPRAATNTGLMYLEGLGTDRDPVAAEAWLLRAARNGDARAAYNLGKLYEGTELAELPDYAAAVTWYQQASDAAYPLASLALGYLMQHGYGTEADTAYAARLYQYAADKGIAQAQLNLAMLYEAGIGVPQDLAQARLRYR
ncbi:MAG: tetratricopeptide repeat protein, partial [Devosia sp.]|nr:tetratricopeptide repeat protein [Devosia sp.]